MFDENKIQKNKEYKKEILKIYPKPEEYKRRLKENSYLEYLGVYEKVIEIAEIVRKHGGRAVLVGGSVRDNVLSRLPKDFDLEIHGIASEKLYSLIKHYGKVFELGKKFGILKIILTNGIDIDLTVIKESETLENKKNFYIHSIRESARKRDFTMNTLAADPLSGELFNYFNGLEDIENKILRVTDKNLFKEDALRVLRALQFVGRYSLKIDPESLEIMRSVVPYLKDIAKERIAEEWKKMLLKAEMPSLSLSAGMILGVFHELYPELVNLNNTEQEEEWHPEGNVWNHTLLSVDQSAKIVRRENLQGDDALTILLASLCHDLGKPLVTKKEGGRLRSLGHEVAGKEPAQKFLSRIGISSKLRDKIVKLVINHMIPTVFYINELENRPVKDSAIKRLARRIEPANIYELVLVAESDHLGRGEFAPEIRAQMLLNPKEYLPGEYLLERARRLEVIYEKAKPLTRGKDWINLGFKAGKNIGILISLADRCRDELKMNKEEIFKEVYNCKIIKDKQNKEYRDSDEAIIILKNLLEKKFNK